jgi:hypothetical protein
MDAADALDCGDAIQKTMILRCGTLQDNALRQGSGRSSAPSTETDNEMTSGLWRRNPELEIPLAPEFHLTILYYSV